MNWTGFTINGVFKDLSHLVPTTLTTEIKEQVISLEFSFGSHCFTDEKDNGPVLPIGRYWSEDRYQCSLQLPTLIRDNFVSSFAVPYYNAHKNGEQYHYMEAYDYLIFFEIKKPVDLNDTLKIIIISAYEKDKWGEVPSGKPYKVRWILSERLAGNSIIKRKKR